MSPPELTHRTQLLLDEDRYGRLRRRANERGTSVASLIREAIDRTFPEEGMEAEEAGRLLLEAEPMPVEDWPDMKREMLDEMYPGPE